MRIEVKELNSILLIVYQVDQPTERDIANFEGRGTYTTDLLFRVDAHLRGGGSRVVVDVSLMSYDGELMGTLMQILKCVHEAGGWMGIVGTEALKWWLDASGADEILPYFQLREDALARAAAWKPGSQW